MPRRAFFLCLTRLLTRLARPSRRKAYGRGDDTLNTQNGWMRMPALHGGGLWQHGGLFEKLNDKTGRTT